MACCLHRGGIERTRGEVVSSTGCGQTIASHLGNEPEAEKETAKANQIQPVWEAAATNCHVSIGGSSSFS
mgnify:CR=1 FL=1